MHKYSPVFPAATQIIIIALCASHFLVGCMTASAAAGQRAADSRKPVIIDTDVGSDFDDSVAIMLALQNDELDVKLIVTATNDTTARARIVAKYLLATNRTDVPIGIGLAVNNCRQTLFSWADDISLDSYQKDHGGVVHEDGVQSMYDVIKASAVPVTIVAIAPATNFPALLKRYPDAVHRASVVAMSGSLYRGYGNSSQPAAEYNVWQCAVCSRQMYTAGWALTTTPLDTCGVARMYADSFDLVLGGLGPYSTILLASWIRWCSESGSSACSLAPLITDVFYDAVAVTLATSQGAKFMDIEARKVVVTDDGHTVISESGTEIQAALNWHEGGTGLSAFQMWLGGQLAKNSASSLP
ncbi:non-specific ribonucleoside hydrolase RihC-like [Sycon ciliatum]|uniref:non-specific ribonucleoside hydrolase RihC-like n=1 Tax=Sycon ciliatum TaxID=27933 RepID=UPI0031F68CE7